MAGIVTHIFQLKPGQAIELQRPLNSGIPSGSTVIANPESKFPASMWTFTYQWTLNGINIPGATDSSYTPTNGQIGSTLVATLVATPIPETNGSGVITNASTAPLLVVAGPSLERTIDNPNPVGTSASDYFGSSLAIDGNTIVVGATGEDDTNSDSGKVYIIDLTTGNILHTLNNPNPQDDAGFGGSVAIGGNYVAVSASGHDSGVNDVGIVYVFNKTTGGLERTISNPTPAEWDEFGSNLEISGTNLIVGEYNGDNEGQGKVYVYDITNGNTIHTLNNPNPDGQETEDVFGSYGGIGVSGDNLLIGAPGEGTSWNAYGKVYVYSITTGSLVRTIDNPDSQSGDQFGNTVALEGNIGVVGSYGETDTNTQQGRIHIFDISNGNLLATIDEPIPGDYGHFGFELDISNGKILASSQTDPYEWQTGPDDTTGNVHVFDTSGNWLYQMQNPNPVGTAEHDMFGWSVVIDGNNMIVSARNESDTNPASGKVYHFELP